MVLEEANNEAFAVKNTQSCTRQLIWLKQVKKESIFILLMPNHLLQLGRNDECLIEFFFLNVFF